MRRKRKKKSKRLSLARDLSKPTWKIITVGIFVLSLFALISYKALVLQVLDKERAFKLSRRGNQDFSTLLPSRGRILDRNGKELAVNIDAASIYANPKRIKFSKEVSNQLASELNISQKEIWEKLLSKTSFVWIKRLSEPEEVSKIKSQKLEGVGFIDEPKRVYPNGTLLGQVLGFTDIDSRGIEGIEYQFDSLLTGEPRRITVQKDALGREIIKSPTLHIEQSTSGHDLILTIDSQIQHIVERELVKGIEKTGGEKAMAILMNAETGAVLAAASYPFFDPNRFTKYSEIKRRNLPIWYSFEPGSTMKVFLVAAALEKQKVNPGSKYNCENGRRKVGPTIIRDVHPYGTLTVSEIVKFSSNICASKIAETLGKTNLYEHLTKFGFGKELDIDLPGESAGRLSAPGSWGPVELATISFGQGISVTALQLVTALSAVANGGYLMKPFIVEKIIAPNGKPIRDREPEVIRRVISFETSSQISEMLEDVVEDGTGTQASISGYTVAGKTGTAQIPNPETGGYYRGRYMASFIGFAPVRDSALTLVVAVEAPKKSHYGGTVAAPIFSEIMEKVLFHLNAPSEERITEKVIMPNLRGMSAREILRWAEQKGVKVELTGSGYATDQEPGAGKKIERGAACSVKLEQEI